VETCSSLLAFLKYRHSKMSSCLLIGTSQSKKLSMANFWSNALFFFVCVSVCSTVSAAASANDEISLQFSVNPIAEATINASQLILQSIFAVQFRTNTLTWYLSVRFSEKSFVVKFSGKSFVVKVFSLCFVEYARFFLITA